MLNKEDLINQSLVINLYYLRTMKEFALNIEISFVQKDEQVINDAASFREHFGKLLGDTIKIANKNVSQKMIDSGMFLTPYTSKCEVLTEELIGVNINNDFTIEEEKLVGGVPVVTDELLNKVRNINKEALILTQNFITYTQNILDNTTKNKLFSYSYPTLIGKINHDSVIYKEELDRLIDETYFTPTGAYQNECCLNKSCEMNAMFIRSFIDPKHDDIFKESDHFVAEFQDAHLKETQQLSPDTQLDLSKERLDLVNRFIMFVNKIIIGVLDNNYYFIIEPIFLDNILTETNFYALVLKRNIEET